MTTINDKGGAFNALANYWLTRFEYAATGQEVAVPEWNLADGGADSPFADWCKGEGIEPNAAAMCGSAFETGLRFAAIFAHDAVHCEPGLRAALAEFAGYFANQPAASTAAAACD